MPVVNVPHALDELKDGVELAVFAPNRPGDVEAGIKNDGGHVTATNEITSAKQLTHGTCGDGESSSDPIWGAPHARLAPKPSANIAVKRAQTASKAARDPHGTLVSSFFSTTKKTVKENVAPSRGRGKVQSLSDRHEKDCIPLVALKTVKQSATDNGQQTSKMPSGAKKARKAAHVKSVSKVVAPGAPENGPMSVTGTMNGDNMTRETFQKTRGRPKKRSASKKTASDSSPKSSSKTRDDADDVPVAQTPQKKATTGVKKTRSAKKAPSTPQQALTTPKAQVLPSTTPGSDVPFSVQRSGITGSPRRRKRSNRKRSPRATEPEAQTSTTSHVVSHERKDSGDSQLTEITTSAISTPPCRDISPPSTPTITTSVSADTPVHHPKPVRPISADELESHWTELDPTFALSPEFLASLGPRGASPAWSEDEEFLAGENKAKHAVPHVLLSQQEQYHAGPATYNADPFTSIHRINAGSGVRDLSSTSLHFPTSDGFKTGAYNPYTARVSYSRAPAVPPGLTTYANTHATRVHEWLDTVPLGSISATPVAAAPASRLGWNEPTPYRTCIDSGISIPSLAGPRPRHGSGGFGTGLGKGLIAAARNVGGLGRSVPGYNDGGYYVGTIGDRRPPVFGAVGDGRPAKKKGMEKRAEEDVKPLSPGVTITRGGGRWRV